MGDGLGPRLCMYIRGPRFYDVCMTVIPQSISSVAAGLHLSSAFITSLRLTSAGISRHKKMLEIGKLQTKKVPIIILVGATSEQG